MTSKTSFLTALHEGKWGCFEKVIRISSGKYFWNIIYLNRLIGRKQQIMKLQKNDVRMKAEYNLYLEHFYSTIKLVYIISCYICNIHSLLN